MIALVSQPPLEQTVSYLKSEGWTLVSNNERWYVFEGYEDIDGEAFEIILSKNDSTPDYRLYIQQTLDIVSSLTDKTPETIAGEILRYDRDIFYSRITENVDPSSTPLSSAFKAIAGLKQLFVASYASEERGSQPFYSNIGANSSKILDAVRFGHTYPGSFGYSVESPVNTQIDMFKPPLPQRVIERIVRGLATTDKATKIPDVAPLLEGYETGFNANMCDAILNLSNDHSKAIEFRIKWSKKRRNLPEGLEAIKSVNIQQHHFELLQEASEKLKYTQPEFVTVEGRIVGLRSPHNPQSEDADERKVTVEWDLEDGNTRNVVVPLEKDEYLEALSAHKDNKSLSVNGYIRGTERQLTDPSDFKII